MLHPFSHGRSRGQERLSQGFRSRHTSFVQYQPNSCKHIPRALWLVFPDRHEAIIDRATFEKVQQLLAQKSNKQMEAEKKTVQGELHAAELRLELLPKLLKNLYEDKVAGRITEEDYAILSREYAEEREALKKKVKTYRDRLRRIAESEGKRSQFIRAIRKFMEMRTLTNQILRELIDHIDVYEVEGRGKNRTQRLVIYYKFVGYLEIPANLSARNYKADLRQGVAVEYVSCEPTGNACEMVDEDEPVEEEQ